MLSNDHYLLSEFLVFCFLICQLQVSVDQKHLAEARSGILSILHTIMSSVTLLWSILHQADSSDKPAAASAASTSNINLGSTKVHQAHICLFCLFLSLQDSQGFS